MNNVIAYVAPKNKTMAHSMTLNNRISCIVGISIFGFKTYWEQVFNFMDIKTTPTLTDFLQAETLNAKRKKSYYQRYDVTRLRAFRKQAMMKQELYDNMFARRSGMYYSAGILFQTSIINMKQAQELTKNNQPEKMEHKRCRCGSIKHSRVSNKDCPVGLAMRKAKKLALGMALSKSKAKKTVEDAAAEEERICMAAESAGENAKSDEEASTGSVV